MILSHEIRLGNYLQSEHGIPFQVTAEDIAIIDAQPEGHPLPNPILLTPEIMSKCDFSVKPLGSEEEYDETILEEVNVEMNSSFPNEPVWLTTKCCGCHIKTPHIKHVHQLQNLYHILTGEELKIELP